ncbi:MAG: response regulator [Oligoflexia bacterium]|nr:response regulator [Oligoflexia bacterium]
MGEPIDDFNAAQVSVLIVDDVPSARRVVCRLLQKLGVQNIREACGGEEALKVLDQHATNLVICDWQMPDMQGIDLLSKLREDSRFSAIPFIMITSNVERDNVVAALNGGASDFILKPFNFETLSSKIKKALKGAPVNDSKN